MQTETQNLRAQVEELEQRVDTLERLIDDQILEWATRKQQGHDSAKQRDARENLVVGDTREVVIKEPAGQEGPDAFTKIEGIATFVEPNGLNLSRGTTARVKLTGVNESSANAIAVERVDDGI